MGRLGLDGWTSRGDLAEHNRVSRVRSAGLLVSEDDESVTLVAGIDDTHGNVHNPLTIPKFAITDRREVVT